MKRSVRFMWHAVLMGNEQSGSSTLSATHDALYLIPAIESSTGHLVPGRYRTTLERIEQRFVTHDQFASSTTRRDVWEGLINYLQVWEQAERALDQQVLMALWIGGSFVSAELNPADIDVSPVYDEGALASLHAAPGVSLIKKLIGHRGSIVQKYSVEPFPIPWRGLNSSLFPSSLPQDDQTYLARRGGLDDWWQRVRPPGPRAAPLAPDNVAARGYLEVAW